jgi:Folliculin-interacting protein N-terminus
MLGRLFGNAASSLNSAGYSRDSVVDEEYTRSLLYPEYAAPQHAPTHFPPVGAGRVGDFDDWSGLELDALKDFRIMLAQDALGDSEEPCTLFDTHPIQPSESSPDFAQRTGSLQNPSHRRGMSTTSTLRSPTSPLFAKPQQRFPLNAPNVSFPTRNRSSTFSAGSDEHDPRHLRSSDAKEETRSILNCAFGSSAGASSGAKMHVMPLGSGAKDLPVTPSSPGAGGSTSAGYFRKREPIARAHTSALAGVRPPLHERSQSSSGVKPKLTDAVLITKLFSVNLPDPTELQTIHPSPSPQDGSEIPSHVDYPFPNAPFKGKKPRAKKTPVFAVILVVQLPPSLSNSSRPPSRGGIQAAPTHTSVRSFRNSFNSHSTSPKLGSSGPSRSMDRGDPRVNALVEHWDIIDRALTLMENVSAPKILGHLKQVDSFSDALVSKPSKPKEKTMQRTNQITIYLSPLTLGSDSDLKDTAMQCVQRIRRALRMPRVNIGQAHWGLWNDELIRVARCYGGKEQTSFLVSLLTSFLGAHTAEWMTLLAPSRNHRRRSITRKTTNESDVITTRTVVVSNDRSIARRLVFLLSSFIAGDAQIENGGALYRRPGSAVSLRNAMLHSPSAEFATNVRHSCSPERHKCHNLEHPQGGLLIARGLQRKPSDIQSVKSIPIPANDLSLRKSSAATTSTVIPNPTTSASHFSSSSVGEGGYFPDESSASASLNKIWRTANRDSESSTTSTKWGSLLSGFWSKDSTGTPSGSTAPSASSSIRVKLKETPLEAMVKELANDDDSDAPALANGAAQHFGSFQSQTMPIKLEVNADERVIDVDIGLPGFFGSSNDSALASPPLRNMRHASSVASLDSLASSKLHFSPKGGAKPQSRVAGFLPKFHPDYSLQAVRASKSDLPEIVEQIKSAMLSEPYPPPETVTSGWVDIATTLIADVQTASVKRLCLKRKFSHPDNGKGDSDRAVVPGMENLAAARAIKPRSIMYCGFLQEEAFSYESVRDLDPSLTDVVERIFTREGAYGSGSISPSAISHSRRTSTATSESYRRGNEQLTANGPRSPDAFTRSFPDDLVLGALEDVVKSVNHDLSEAPIGRNSDTHINQELAASSRKSQDNALREGVRSWLLHAEHRAV